MARPRSRSRSDVVGESPELRHGSTVVKAWAPWCGSCRALAPVVETIAAETGVAVADLRVDLDPDRVEQYGIRSVPTLIALHDGTEVGRLVGAQTSDAVRSLFAAATGDGTRVRAGAPRALVAIRAAAGLSLAAAGFVTGSAVLVGAGVALAIWSAGVVRRPTRSGLE